MSDVLQVPADYVVVSRHAERVRFAGMYEPSSAADALRHLDHLEGVYETVLLNARPELDDLLVESCECMLTKWVHRHRRLLSYERYRAVIERVDARNPHGWSRRIYDLGTLPSIARFVRQLDAVPAAIKDPWADAPELRPLAEITLRETFGGFPHLWVQPRETLVVHLGSATYHGALAIVSLDPDLSEATLRHALVRVLEVENRLHGAVLRVSDREDGVVLARRGSVTVECVIFNRPDVLRSVP